MRPLKRQRGVALFTVVFLIVAVGGLAVTVGLVSGQQQLTTVQTFEQTRAYYAARARLDREIESLLDSGACPTLPDQENPDDPANVTGFTTVVAAGECETTTVNEGGTDYAVHEIAVRAFRGSADSGTLVQRTIRVQVTQGPSGP